MNLRKRIDIRDTCVANNVMNGANFETTQTVLQLYPIQTGSHTSGEGTERSVAVKNN